MSHKPLNVIVVPPGPVTDQIRVEIRAALHNRADRRRSAELQITVGDRPLHVQTVSVEGGRAAAVSVWTVTVGLQGDCTITTHATWEDGEEHESAWQLEVLPSDVPSTKLISGIWVVLGASEVLANGEFCETQQELRDQIGEMHELGMDLLIIGSSFVNPGAFYGEHYHTMTLENYRENYAGKACYPSALYPQRDDLICDDPIEVVLSEADRLGMHVMLGLGCYAMFDYTPGSLAWHKEVATELWQRYGHHESVYGWYVSSELPGHFRPHEMRYWDRTDEFRREVVTFFRELRAHIDAFAPETVLMLSPDVVHDHEPLEHWKALSRYCSIFWLQTCAYKERDGDLPREQAIALMKQDAAETGGHIWMNLETFLFRCPRTGKLFRENPPDWDSAGERLVPANMPMLADDLNRIDQVEFVASFCYHGILCSPRSPHRFGGQAAVDLFNNYAAYRDARRADRNA